MECHRHLGGRQVHRKGGKPPVALTKTKDGVAVVQPLSIPAGDILLVLDSESSGSPACDSGEADLGEGAELRQLLRTARTARQRPSRQVSG